SRSAANARPQWSFLNQFIENRQESEPKMGSIWHYVQTGCALFVASSLQAAGTNDLRLWFSKPAAKWTEALPIGNGRMGAMIFGGISDERIQFNEDTLWRGKPHDYVRQGAAEQLPELRRLLTEGKTKQAGKLARDKILSD